eukprot:superscaffoldBa00001329_g10078
MSHKSQQIYLPITLLNTKWHVLDGAIHRAAGPLLKKECASLHGCETGEAKITCGYGLPAKYVIHTVGPIAQGGVGEKQKKALRSCYKNSLQTATANSARSVNSYVMSALTLSCQLLSPVKQTDLETLGASWHLLKLPYLTAGYPPEQAVHEALATVREYLDEHHDKQTALCLSPLVYKCLNLQLGDVISLKGLTKLQATQSQRVMAAAVDS